VGFVDDQDGGASAFVAFGGQDGGGLGGVSRELERSGWLPKVATIISCRPRMPIMGWAGR
jgi:hypothetical protein